MTTSADIERPDTAPSLTTVAMVTLGCARNEVDSEELAARLDAGGWTVWEDVLARWLAEGHEPLPVAVPRATIAVCTRDRPDDLRRCLEGLMAMPDDGQEVVVVDNAPATEATRELVAAYPRVRYVREDRPGLDCARNRALREAHHEVVAFTDDDSVPDPHWLRALLPNFADPLVLCVTGLTMPLELETEAQEWFEQMSTFNRGFKRRVFSLLDLSFSGAGLIAGSRLRERLERECCCHEFE